ncbi:MAG: preprotein translocase subunit SecG [Pseudobdellovibrio sp.]
MITFLAVVHIIACLGLVGLVLLQDSKGGGVFTTQASSSSVLGAGGAATLAQTATKVIAALFAATCIGLSIMSARSEKSVVDSVVPAASMPAATTSAPATESAPTAAPAATTAQPAANEKK